VNEESRVHVYGYEVNEGEVVSGECSSCGHPTTSNQCHGVFLCMACLQAHGTAVKLHGGTMEFKGCLNLPPPALSESEVTEVVNNGEDTL
jgi:hypothetical protein